MQYSNLIGVLPTAADTVKRPLPTVLCHYRFPSSHVRDSYCHTSSFLVNMSSERDFQMAISWATSLFTHMPYTDISLRLYLHQAQKESARPHHSCCLKENYRTQLLPIHSTHAIKTNPVCTTRVREKKVPPSTLKRQPNGTFRRMNYLAVYIAFAIDYEHTCSLFLTLVCHSLYHVLFVYSTELLCTDKIQIYMTD